MTASEVIIEYVSRGIAVPPGEDVTDTDEYYDRLNDRLNDFRCSGVASGLPCPSSRHYESLSVARQIGNVYVGWTYWYGGGKHGEPSAMPWLEDAYYVRAWDEVVPVKRYAWRG